MKKTVKSLLCILCILGAFCSFAACGADGKSDATEKPARKQYITGRYELEEILWADGTTASGSVLEEVEAVMGDMYVELFSDNTAQLALYSQIHDMEFSEDKMWQIDSELISYEFSVSNGRVTLQSEGDTYIFVKK